jgi:hypothetical protein
MRQRRRQQLGRHLAHALAVALASTAKLVEDGRVEVERRSWHDA